MGLAGDKYSDEVGKREMVSHEKLPVSRYMINNPPNFQLGLLFGGSRMFEQRIPRPVILLSLSSRDLRADSLIGVRIYGPGVETWAAYGNLQFSLLYFLFFFFFVFGTGSFEVFLTYGTRSDSLSRTENECHWMYIYKGQISSVDRN